MQLINFEIDKHIATITLNHPEKRNCLAMPMIEEILQAFDTCENQHVRVIVLRTLPGSTVWSSGHDVQEIPLDKQDPVTWNVPYVTSLRRVRNMLIPVIAEIEGTVWGGACDLVMSCDMIIATENVTFAITPAKLGIPYNTAGVSHFLGALPTHVVKEMFLTAQPLPVEKAHRYGLVNYLVPADQLESQARQVAERIASMAPLCIRVIKAELAKLMDSISISADDFEHIQMLRREAFRSDDFQEGMNAFREKRHPQFHGK